MSLDENEKKDQVPFWQKLADSPFWLLILGIFVMVLFYTGWGIFEIMTLPTDTLP